MTFDPTQMAQPNGYNWGALMDQVGTALEPVPLNDYPCTITKAEATTSTNGKMMFKLTWNIDAGPHANRKVWGNMTLSPENPNAVTIFFTQMAALGLTKEYFSTNPAPEAVAGVMVGRRAMLNVGTRVWQGQLRNDIKAIKPLLATTVVVPPTPAAPMTQPFSGAPIQPMPPAPVPAVPIAPTFQAPVAPAPVAVPALPAPVPAPQPVPHPVPVAAPEQQQQPVAAAPAPTPTVPAAPLPPVVLPPPPAPF